MNVYLLVYVSWDTYEILGATLDWNEARTWLENFPEGELPPGDGYVDIESVGLGELPSVFKSEEKEESK